MDVVKTVKQKLLNNTRYFGLPLGIYREVLEAVSLAVKAEWSAISGVEHSKSQKSYVENLIHATRSNLSPKYSEFDQRFHKFPSYLRRAAIAEAIGNVSSHMTRLKQWEGSPKGKAPTFNPCCKSFPVFYKGVMSEWVRNGKVKLKLFTGSDWIWFTVSFEKLKPHRFPFSESWERQNPMLVYNGYKWHIHFPFQRKVKLKDKDFTRPILSVDLGLDCTTTASVVYIDGIVGHREFINYASEKDRLYTLIGTIAVKSAQTYYIPEGSSFCKSLCRKVSNITEEIAHQCSARLVAIAANLAVRVLSLSIWVTSRSRKLLWSRKAEKEVPLLATGAHSEVHEVQGLWGRYPLKPYIYWLVALLRTLLTAVARYGG